MKGGKELIKDLVLKNRSYRRYYQDSAVGMETLRELIDIGRLSSSGTNRQSLKYILSCEPETNAKIFKQLAWAAALKDWPGPGQGERPAAYIIVLEDTAIGKPGVDHGIACTNILLGAVEKGLGGCMIGNVKRELLRKELSIDQRYEILLVVAIGKPKEIVQIDTVDETGSTAYWRDERHVHHVPKRKLEDLKAKYSQIGRFATGEPLSRQVWALTPAPPSNRISRIPEWASVEVFWISGQTSSGTGSALRCTPSNA